MVKVQTTKGKKQSKGVKSRGEHTLQAGWGGSQETWRPISVLAGFSFQNTLCSCKEVPQNEPVVGSQVQGSAQQSWDIKTCGRGLKA